jgi:hypothetical protein
MMTTSVLIGAALALGEVSVKVSGCGAAALVLPGLLF